MTEPVSLDRAYAIRSEMIEFIEHHIRCGNRKVSNTDVVAEMLVRHRDVRRETMHHFATRVAAHWGLPGLDYKEAFRSRHSPTHLWYPVERDGALLRVALSELTAGELEAMIDALRQQNEVMLSRLESLHR
jgi:hypothetical protein